MPPGLRLFSRVAAANLHGTRLEGLARRGYAGCEMSWDHDFGAGRGQLPAEAARALLEEHGLRLAVRVSTRLPNGSTDPSAHVTMLTERLAALASAFGDVVEHVVVEVSCRKWQLAQCAAFASGLAELDREDVTLATARTFWGTQEPIDRVLVQLAKAEPSVADALRLSLDPAPWLGGATSAVQDTGYDYMRHVRHLSLSPGHAPRPANYWETAQTVWAARAATTHLVTLPDAVASGAAALGAASGGALVVHPFERLVREAFENAATGQSAGAALARKATVGTAAAAPTDAVPTDAAPTAVAARTVQERRGPAAGSDKGRAEHDGEGARPASLPSLRGPPSAAHAARSAVGHPETAAAAVAVCPASSKPQASSEPTGLSEAVAELRGLRARLVTAVEELDMLHSRLQAMARRGPGAASGTEATSRPAAAARPPTSFGLGHLDGVINAPFKSPRK